MGRKDILKVGRNEDLKVLNHTGWGNTKDELIEVYCENGQWKIQSLNDCSITKLKSRAEVEEYIRGGNFVYAGVGGTHAKHKKKGYDELER